MQVEITNTGFPPVPQESQGCRRQYECQAERYPVES